MTENLYRLVHEGSLHVLQQPLASVHIKHPVEEAKIPAGACYQKTSRIFNYWKQLKAPKYSKIEQHRGYQILVRF